MLLLSYGILLLAWACCRSGGQQFDPVYDRCARWHHSAMLRRTSIFIDGGVEMYRDNVTRWLGSNKYIYEFDMSQSWDATTNFTESRISRVGNTSATAGPPNMLRGGLYAAMSESNRLFTFGGSTFLANDSDPDWAPPSQDPTTLWAFDTELRNWESMDISASVPWRPNWGSVSEDVAHSVGFFLNGMYDRGSSYGLYTSVQYQGGQVTNASFNQIRYLGGMVMIDLHTQETKNVSTDSLGAPRVAGGLFHCPGFGKSANGTLLAVGGMVSSGAGTDTFTNGNLVDFGTVSLCDSFKDQNATWVNQTTTGDIPPPRMDFCSSPGIRTPQDNSSFNLYIHGGIDPRNNTIYDDVYILSLPSFTWTRASQGAGGPGRFGHSCNSAGKRQMLLTGGARDAALLGVETTGDIPDLNATTCDSGIGVQLFDMTDLTWSTFYNASPAVKYRVPDSVVKRIGGSPDGNATMTQPAAGFDHPAVYTMFHPPPPSNSSAPTTSLPSSSIGGGAIAGAVIGSLAGTAFVALAIWIWFRRRRHHHRLASSSAEAGAGGGNRANDPNKRALDHENGGPPLPPSELPGNPAEIHEKPAEEAPAYEKAGSRGTHPLEGGLEPQELDATDAGRHELGGSDVQGENDPEHGDESESTDVVTGWGFAGERRGEVVEGREGRQSVRVSRELAVPEAGEDGDGIGDTEHDVDGRREMKPVGRKSAFAEDTR